MRGVRKTFEAENAPVRALRGVDLTSAAGEFVALTGPVRLRQVHAAEPGRRAGPGRRGQHRRGRRGDHRAERGRAGPDAPPAHRHRLPVLQPARGHDRAGERGPGRDHRRPQAPDRGDRARDLLDLLGIGDKAAAVAGRAVRRPAPAAGHRPGAGQRADAAAGRRADRRAGLRGRPGGHRAAAPAARRRPDHPAGHPRRRAWPTRPSAWCGCSTAGSSRSRGRDRPERRTEPARPVR